MIALYFMTLINEHLISNQEAVDSNPTAIVFSLLHSFIEIVH